MKLNCKAYSGFLVFIFCFFSGTLISATGDTLYYSGKIHISKSQSYNYVMRFVILPNQHINGYSLSDAQGPNETKTRIQGTYDSLNHTLQFEETTVLRSKVDLQANALCFVHARLKFKKDKLFETLTGSFTGMQPDGKTSCGKGDIKLINTHKAKELLAKAATLSTRPPVKEITNEEIDPSKVVKVVDNNPKGLEFTAPVLKLRIWDNGEVDGDRISLNINGKMLLQNYTLDSLEKDIDINLPISGIVTIIVTALNEGSSPPNTCMMMIESSNEQYPVEMRARQGEKRTILLRMKNTGK